MKICKSLGIAKPCTHLHQAPSTSSSTQLHPASLQHPQSALRFLKFLPQNPFWANLGRKSQICSFSLKIGTHGISRMLILIPTSVF